MLRHRTKKQIIVALVFFGFWSGVIGTGVWATREPPAPPTPTPRSVTALESLGADVLRTVSGRADLVGRLLNRNAQAGAADVRYAFVLRSGGAAVRTIQGRTHILPGREKYVAVLNEEVPSSVDSVDLTVEQPEWTFVSPGFVPPSLVLVNQSQRVLPGEPQLFEFKGLLANQANVDYTRVEVIAVGLDQSKRVVGISQSFVGSLRARERREFTAQWPMRTGRTVSQVIVLPEVNVFRADAVQQREGSLDVRDLPVPASPSTFSR